jgi:hypothetical protein
MELGGEGFGEAGGGLAEGTKEGSGKHYFN